MGKIDLEILESDFNQKYTSTYDLSILIGMDRFSFLLIDEQNRLLGLRNYSLQVDNLNLKEHLQDIYINDDLLKMPFRKVFLAIENKRHTLIPKRLYRKQDGAVYLDKLFGEVSNQEVFADEVAGIDALSVYQIQQEVEQLLHGYFSEAKQVHLGTAILTGFRSLAEQQPGKKHICLRIRQTSLCQLF